MIRVICIEVTDHASEMMSEQVAPEDVIRFRDVFQAEMTDMGVEKDEYLATLLGRMEEGFQYARAVSAQIHRAGIDPADEAFQETAKNYVAFFTALAAFAVLRDPAADPEGLETITMVRRPDGEMIGCYPFGRAPH